MQHLFANKFVRHFNEQFAMLTESAQLAAHRASWQLFSPRWQVNLLPVAQNKTQRKLHMEIST